MIDARQAVLAPSGAGGGVAISAVRFFFRTLSAVAPSLAARAAFEFWFAPPRPRFKTELLETGTREDIVVNGRKVATWSWGEGPAVILMHGWGGSAAQMTAFVQPLVRAGYRAIAFDAPAHGASGPSRIGARKSTFLDFADVLIQISRDAGEVAGLIAHSGGCTAAGLAMRRFGWRVPAAIFLAPMASPMSYRAMFQRAVGISDEALRRFAAQAETRIGFTWEELEMTELPRVFTDTPRLLVVHDREDRETSWREGAAIAETWPNATLRTTEGLGHRRALRDPETIDAAIQFIRERR